MCISLGWYYKDPSLQTVSLNNLKELEHAGTNGRGEWLDSAKMVEN